MGIGLLSNPIISTSVAVGAIVIPLFLAARSAAQFVGANQAYVRRALTASLFGVSLGILAYEFDKLLRFGVTHVIAVGLSLSLPVYTYGVVTGLSIFFLTLSSPFVRQGEKMDSTVLLTVNAIVGGLNGTIQYCIASAFAVNTFGWFGGKVPLWLLIIMGVLGFIFMAIFSVSGNVMVASWFRPKGADGADSDNSAGSAGCVYAILSWVNLAVYLAFFIVLFRFLGWGGLFAYIGVSTGLLVALVIISTIVELLPTWVLVVAAIIITVAFQVARGYPSILALLKL